MDTLPDPQSKSSSNVSPHRREKSRDSLVYLTTCMIGHHVEAHLKDGSVYSGIFHAADMEKVLGIVLKMASLIKESTLRGQRSRSEFFRKPPLKTLIIPADELVQVVAENISVSSDGILNAVQSEKAVERLTDSSISKSLRVDQEREAGRYVDVFDDSGFNEEDKLLDTCNDQTFGDSPTSSVQKPASSIGQKPASSNGKVYEDIVGDNQSSRNNTNVDQSCSDDAWHILSKKRSKDFPPPGSSISESQLGERRKNNNTEVSHSNGSAGESVSGYGDFKEGAKLDGGGTSALKIFKQFEAAMDTLPAPQSKSSSNGSPCRREKSRDSLVYLTTCMIGLLVEVHLKNGSVYSGIFHAADVEKDFGIVLKMASLIKDGTLRNQRSRSEFFRKPPLKTLIIPADELVQVVAENLSVSSDGILNAVQSEKPVERLTDSSISKSLRVDQEREAGRAVDVFDDSGFNEEDKSLDTCNDQTFGDSPTSSVQKPGSSIGQKPASSSGKGYEDIMGDSQSSRNNTNVDQSCSDDARHILSEQRSKDFPPPGSTISESQLGERRKNNNTEVSHSNRSAEASVSGHGVIKEGAKVGGGGIVAERERQGSKVSGKTKSESSFGQSDSRSSESHPTPSTPSRPGLPASSSTGSLSSSKKLTLNPDSKLKQFEAAMDTHTLPDPQSKSSSNVSPHRREMSRDSLVYLTTCMIGHHVEAHLKDGSVYSGIFHAADMEKDFGIVLKMASLIKESTLRGHEFSRKPPLKTFIIPAAELVQVVAENLSVSSDGMLNAVQSEKPVKLLTDSSISKSRQVNHGRVLIPWEPDGNVPPGLDNVFDDTSKRRWNQFEVNESLFGVKSTFDETQYTTTLRRSTRTKELEEKAQTIAREIVDEITQDVHVAEERGRQLNEKSDIDEETKYSAVRRVDKFDDSGFNEEDDKLLDSCNDQTFDGSSTSSGQKSASSIGQKPASSGKRCEDVPGDSQPSRNNTYVDQSCSISGDNAWHLPSEQPSKDFPTSDSSISESQLGERRKNNTPEVSHSSRSAGESVSGHGDFKEGATLGGGGTSASKIFKQFEAAMDTLSAPLQSKSTSNGSPHRREKSRDSLVYLTTCMIGHLVEVHLKNGSVYSGIFHAADVEKDFGIVLKMASLIKDGTLGEQRSRSEFLRKPPLKTLIIPADELVQVVAENISVSSDGILNAVQSEKAVERLTDSSISKSLRVDQEREAGRAVDVFDDSGFNEEDKSLDTCNDQTFGDSPTSSVQKPGSSIGQKPASSSGKGYEDIMGDSQSSRNNINVDQSCSDDARHILSEQRSKDFPPPGSTISESQLGERRKNNNTEVSHSSRSAEASVSGHGVIKEGAKVGGGGIVAERERQGIKVSGKTKSESSFGQSDSRSSESHPTPSTPSRPGLPASSSTGSLSSSKKLTLNPDSKLKQFEAAMDTLPDPQSKSSSNVSPNRREKSRDSLVYLTTCMIGHHVEAHLKDGSVYSGIFHAADMEKVLGIVLKMASLIKESTLRGHEFSRKPPLKTFIIPADELVQVVAENISVSSDGILNAVQSEKAVERLTDSSISKSLRVDQEREAGRYVDVFDDSGFNEEDKLLDTCNDQTFGDSPTSSVQKPASSIGQKPASSSGKGDSQSSRNSTNVAQSCSDDARHIRSEQRSKDFPPPGSSISESQLGERRKNNNTEVSHSSRSAEASVSGHGDIKEGAKIGGGGTSGSKTVADRERQGSQVSGKTKSESSFGQWDSRSSKSRPAPSTPSRPGPPPSSSIGPLSSSEKFTFNPDAKEFEPPQPPADVQAQSPTEYTSFYCPAAPTQQMPVQAQSPPEYTSFYCPAAPTQQMPMQAQSPPEYTSFYYLAAPIQQMPVQAQSPMADGSFYYPAAPLQQIPGGYGIQPQYFEQQMFYPQYYGQQYGQTGYPQYAQAQYPQQQQQMMMGQPPMPQMMMGQPLMPQMMMGQPPMPQMMMGQPPMPQMMMGQPPMPKMMMGQPHRPSPPYHQPENP